MQLQRSFMAVVALSCMSSVAWANDGLSKSYEKCVDKSGGVTTAMIACINTETQNQDVRLNKAYKDVMADLSPERKKQLQEVQRLWLKFRDGNCKFYADPDGGTLAVLYANSCFLNTTAARAKELEGLKPEYR